MIIQQQALLNSYKSDPRLVLSRLDETRLAILKEDRAEVYLTGDVAKLTDAVGAKTASEVWHDFLGDEVSLSEYQMSRPLEPFRDYSYRDTSARNRRRVKHVMSVIPSSADTCSMAQTVPVNIRF